MKKQQRPLENSAADVGAVDEIDVQSLSAIRAMLAEEDQPNVKPKRRRKAVEAESAAAAAPLEFESDELPFEGFDDASDGRRKRFDDLAPPEQSDRSSVSIAGLLSRLKERVIGYRPTARHIALFVLALVVFMRPLLVLGLAILLLFTLIVVFLILGYDGFWQRAMGLGRWYARRHPTRAAELHGKLDAFVMKWDAMLDRFPEGSVDGLYLPDFGDMAQADARHGAALDRRFKEMREKEV